jgi:hypothetical protein
LGWFSDIFGWNTNRDRSQGGGGHDFKMSALRERELLMKSRLSNHCSDQSVQ